MKPLMYRVAAALGIFTTVTLFALGHFIPAAIVAAVALAVMYIASHIEQIPEGVA